MEVLIDRPMVADLPPEPILQRSVARCTGALAANGLCPHAVYATVAERMTYWNPEGYVVYGEQVPYCGLTEVYAPGTGVVPRVRPLTGDGE